VKSLVVAQGYNQWATSTGYAGTDESDTTPPAGETASSTFTDVLGRTTASWKYNTATPTGKRADATATNYTYTAAGRTQTIADNAGNVWQYTYDLHGRQTQLVDPGAGMSSTVYSPGGEVLSTKDGRGVQLTYQYDKLARKTAEFNTTGNVAATGSDQLAAWTYDTLAKGQPTAQSRYTNGASDATHTYTTAVDGYTALYQSTGTTVTIPSAEGNLAGIYHDGSIYSDTTSRLDATRYYGEGGLPGEIVTYSYTPTGLITSFGGTNTYLNDVAYSPQGKVLQTNFGVSGRQFVRTEQYDLPTTRLLKVQDQAQPVTAALDATSYTYNPAGAITSESDVQSGVAVADTQCFGYDQQGRLTAAWTDTNGVTASVASTSVPIAGIGGCVDAAPVAGKVTGGPAPYWESFGYGPLGDRIAETNHDTSVSGTAADRSQTLAYNGSGTTPASLPSAVRSVTSTTSTGSTTSTYGYDTAGNTTSRAGQSFTYDAEGHTASVTDTGTGATTGYTYAADGTLLLQRNPATHQTILYLPYGQELHLDTSSGAVSGLRYYSASPDGVTVLRDSAGTVVYELTDPLRTATTIVDATSLAVTRRYSDPYGNVRGPAPLAWPDQHGFLGKPVDSTTGLSLLGARQYDSVTGRFLSVDPILESGDGRQMNGYSYAADNPVNASDPNGLRAMGDASGSSCGWNGTCTGSAAASPTPDQALVQWISHIHTYHKLAGLMVSEDDPHYARLKQMATTIAKDGQGYGLNGPTQEFLDWDSYCQAHPSFCGPDLSGAIKSALYDENGVMRHFMASYSILVNGDDTARPGSGLGSAEILLTSTPLAMLTGVFTYRSKGTTPGRDNSPKYGPSTIKIDNTKTYLVGSVNESGDFEYGYRGPNVQAPESTLPTELPPGPDTNPLQDLENGFPKTKAGEIVGGTADLLGGFGVGHGPQM
jgi:RHS repeat-associated protein